MSLKAIFKKRNWTRKSWTSFKENVSQYLTPEECAKLPIKNELATFKPQNINLKSKVKLESLLKENHVSVSKALIQKISKEIRKETHPHFFLFKDEPLIRGTVNTESGYPVFKDGACKPNVVLDVHKWSKKFPFFDVSTKLLNPNGDTWLLSIDFVGSGCFHLFTKSIYSDDYKHIQLPKRNLLQTHGLLANEPISSDQAMWLDNGRILYVCINRYYNDSGVYLYDLELGTHKLIYKAEKGMFIELDDVDSGLFILISAADYNSEEIHVIDTETLNVSLLLPRKFSVTYPYLNHEHGLWTVCKKDKGRDLIGTTQDFKRWTILYENKNPNEQILNADYARNCFVFTLETLTGLCLYMLNCGKLTLVEKSFDYYCIKGFEREKFMVHKCKYTCPYKPITLSIDPYKVDIPVMKPRYHEEEVFIHPHLRVTLLYKKKKLNSPCLLRGYGAYNTYEHASESPFYYPLLERGFVIAIAHLRGGGEYGYKGYNEGRMKNKKNTFQDFMDTAHFLIDKKWTSRDKLAIWGRSCGGLLISSVLNQEPDLCKVALAGVPFMTPLETMSTYKTPLGIETRSELGDSTKKSVQNYIHSYAPLEHIQKDGAYPNLLIYTNLNDTLVPYTEPLAYYRAMKEVDVYQTGKSDLSFYLDVRFGHHQGTLLKDKCDHYGMLFGYVLKHLNEI
jgi:protease II